ncbi:MAG: HlyC/CorC family transporter [Bacteroidales bacterium]|nr:HlyC/CorC family transporter [Bacteroidales bacterium]
MDQILVILITLLLAAFFAGMEIAFLASNKLRLELDRKQGLFSSRFISVFQARSGQYIATIQLGNNIAIVIYGLYMARWLDPLISHYIVSDTGVMIIQTFISTFIVLLLAEFLPKALVRINPNLALTVMSFPLMIIFIVLYPVSIVVHRLSNLILKSIIRSDSVAKYDQVVFGKVDLNNLIDESIETTGSKASEEQDEFKLFQNALDFSNVRIRDCMIPRTEIVAINIADPVDELRQKYIDSGFSKILVFENNMDNMVGYVTSKSLFKNPPNIKSAMLNISYIPETMAASKLLKKFIQEHRSMAVVVDEFGGISGIVTIEDIMEEIFGEIDDEHDIDEFIEKNPEAGFYIFSGRLEIDYLNEKYSLGIPESEEYDTLAGFIIYQHQNIPKVNDKIITEAFEIRILKVTRTRIELVSLKTTGGQKPA